MISVAEAKELIQQHTAKLSPVLLELTDAVGHFLAESIFTPIDIPAFNQAAMDGYAFQLGANTYKVVESIMAGASTLLALEQHQCARIYTGAPVPDSANTVVMQEKIELNVQQITILDDELFIGKNIRMKGSELKAGELLLEKNSYLNAAAIGLLASAGITQITVFPKPTLAIITTGNELQKPGNDLQNGQVFEANSFALKAALKQLQLPCKSIVHVADNLVDTIYAIQKALQVADVILITGGISVGDYDFVKEAILHCQVNPIFHKINQKPGKPLFYGVKNHQSIFGLPGNPAAVLTCFYEYVTIAIHQLMGNPNTTPTSLYRPIKDYYCKKSGTANFLKGFYNDVEVRILGAQESYRLSSMATANCFVYLPEETTEINPHDMVELHVIPTAFN